jgi:TolB-like protein
VSGHGDLLPKQLHTIAVPSFGNNTSRARMSDSLSRDVVRELISRTRYRVVADPEDADAILTGTVVGYNSYPTILQGARAAGVQVNVIIQARLTERTTGKVLFDRPAFEARERYEISIDQAAYFDESNGALDRISRDVARSLISAILENF